MKRSTFLNVIAVLLMLAVLVCCIMFIGSSRNWFGAKRNERGINTESVSGAVSIIRRGSGYSLKSGIRLTEGDGIRTAAESSATLSLEDVFSFTLSERCEMELTASGEEKTSLLAKNGSVFFDVGKGSGVFAELSCAVISPGDGCIFSVESVHGTQTVRVFRGEANVSSELLGASATVPSGKQLVIVQDENGESSFTDVTGISPQTMNSFLLDMCMEKEGLYFTKEQLSEEMVRREQEKEAARIAREEYEKEIIARGGTVPVITRKPGSSQQDTGRSTMTCTIQIVCDTILSNMDLLTPGKEAFVPANGVILAVSRVEFEEGESVFDVLKRACAYAGIPIDYSYTVAFSGYYIEAINNLYEFDCGSQSGWMYKVNGWFPNYGSSNYTLKDGDDIVWAYTCHGLGTDIGAVYEE